MCDYFVDRSRNFVWDLLWNVCERFCEQEDESRSPTVAAAGGELCAAAAVEFDEDECEVEDFVPVEIPPPMDEIQTHTLPTQQRSVSRWCSDLLFASDFDDPWIFWLPVLYLYFVPFIGFSN